METNRIFSADQIQIHPELPDIIKQYTKAVLKVGTQKKKELKLNSTTGPCEPRPTNSI